jgi:hypothetical protein
MKTRLGEKGPAETSGESLSPEGVSYSRIEAGMKASATFKTKAYPRIVFANAKAMPFGMTKHE